jgi:hypothetical protein
MSVRTCDREATEAPSLLERLRLLDSSLWRDDDRVKDEAVLEALDFAHHLGLVVLRAIVVNNTETTKQGDVNGHVVFGDCVHGRGDKWRLEGYALCDGSVEGNIDGREACG